MSEPIAIDLTGVSTTLEPVPDGHYEFIVAECNQRTGKESGAPYLACVFAIQGGDFDGRKLFHNFSLQQQSLWNLKAALKALGWNPAELEQKVQLDPDDLVGTQGTAFVVTQTSEEYGARNTVRRILPAGSVEAGGKDAALF